MTVNRPRASSRLRSDSAASNQERRLGAPQSSTPSTPSMPSAPSAPSAHERLAPVLEGRAPIDAEAREEMIREAAYFRAERRGFESGHEIEDWLAAEREFERWLDTRAAPRRYSR